MIKLTLEEARQRRGSAAMQRAGNAREEIEANGLRFSAQKSVENEITKHRVYRGIRGGDTQITIIDDAGELNPLVGEHLQEIDPA